MIEARKTPSAEETRERILNAARDVVAKKGKRGATTREIADVAGVNEATLFRHFGNKETLLVAVVQHFCGHVVLRDVVGTLHGEISEDLLEIGRVFMARLESQMDVIRWSLVEQDYEEDLFASSAWRPQMAVHEVMVDFMKARVESGELRGEPKSLAMVFMGVIFMHVLSRKKFPDSILHRGDPDAALRFYIDVFLNGVKNGHA